jgi:hypothetical protein
VVNFYLKVSAAIRGVNESDQVVFGSDHIILLFFLIRFEPKTFKFGSKNFDPYLTRPV